jgi:hypothetical protein
MSVNGTRKYPQGYLDEINQVLTNRMDGNASGKKDGKVTTEEAYKDLHIDRLLSGLEVDSEEYNKLKSLTDKIPQALSKYAGEDGIFQAQEWAEFLKGDEWEQVLDTFHSSSNFSKIEMGWIDDSRITDGKVTKGEVKVGLFKSLAKANIPLICDKKAIMGRIETLVDKYAGKDGVFTVDEYTAMKNDTEYKQILKDYRIFPFGNK